jgi:cyclic pyranopterin phosphate synthase
MKDLMGRKISYLRVSVTDKCNLRCRYCMPEEGVIPKKHFDMLSLEEMVEVIKYSSLYGIDRVRITGGEPLVKKGIIDFITSIRKLERIKKINITTNGTLLRSMAKDLKEAGINEVNISLDTLDKDKYKQITRCGNLDDVFEGIDAALKVGFDKVKINTVLINRFNDDEINKIISLAENRPLYVRFIELMTLGEASNFKDNFISAKAIMDKLNLIPIENFQDGGGPAEYYKLDGYKGFIGFINPVSNCFCENCNRIRLTSDGKLMPCLHSDIKVDIFDVVKNKDYEGLKKAIEEVIKLKPERHELAETLNSGQDRYMSQIGG